MISGSPTPEEAAAALAAVQRFLSDTAVAAPAEEPQVSVWLRTALLEGVEREPVRGWT